MACVLVPAAEAVLTTAAEKILAAKEEKHPAEFRANFSRKLNGSTALLWGGSGCLLSSTSARGDYPVVPLPDRSREPGGCGGNAA